MALRAEGYDVCESGDGEEALQETRSATPDVIVADVVLPKVDGFELLNALRADVATRDVPFIMLAGFDQPLSAITRAKAAGATTVRIAVPSGDARQRCRRRPAGEPGSPREGEARSPARPRRDGPCRRRLEPCGGSHRARLPCLRTTLKASGVVRLSVGHTYYCPSNGCGWWCDAPGAQMRKLI